MPLASDDPDARASVSDLVHRLGLAARDRGGLRMAREIEDIPQMLFPGWKRPLLISTTLWVCLYVVCMLRRSICNYQEDVAFSWDQAKQVLHHVNKTCDCHALWLLAMCYLPGCLAGYLQLWRLDSSCK